MPILKITYSGSLSVNDYYATSQRRTEMLDTIDGSALLLVDLQELSSFPDAAVVRRSDSALNDRRIHHILAVLPEDLYRRVARAVLQNAALPVLVFPTIAAALDAAETLLAG
jgi:hypothetical protein